MGGLLGGPKGPSAEELKAKEQKEREKNKQIAIQKVRINQANRIGRDKLKNPGLFL